MPKLSPLTPPDEPVQRFEVRLPKSLHATFVALAHEHRRSINNEVVTALTRYATEQARRRKPAAK